MTGFAFDPAEAFRALNERGVRYVVIGGVAATLHGSSVITSDTDICYARDDANLERLADALRDLQAKLRGVDEDVPFILDAKTLRLGDSFTFVTTVGALDVLAIPSGTSGYDDLERRAIEVDVDGVMVKVASKKDLIRMKEAAGRPKDQYGLLHLRAVLELDPEDD